MKPGDVVTCGCCGAQARAEWISERPWQEGWPLLLTWTHGPHPRHESTAREPELCLWCHERRAVLGDDAEPLYRPAPDAPLPHPLPRVSRAGEGPLNVAAAEGVAALPQRGGNKAPLERPKAQLGLFG